ncbi:CYTH and CHAD domain-containing protein [Rhizobium viscosum]|uniref:Inorganic triphosphatase YgiF n=1 Tax=Rhizobium viscosum TaxID=1673 RepID=A0ABR9IVM7_RHIVS|nr:CHAD domain-containing protein [Rhizobium viscosum]MBE1507268.1 inorganic triphosphatase YgiF [Rhizobium viscosum]
MPSEIEIKLDLSNEALETLIGSDILGEPREVLRQHSIYFDTADRKLKQEGFSLRIRHTGDARVQTVKATGPAKSLFSRSEWETPIESDEPVLDLTSPLRSEFGADLEVDSLFEVLVERRAFDLEENRSKLEAVVDQGEVVSGCRQTLVRELEIELKDGGARDLFVFARKIDAVAPFRFGVLSKSERGYLLQDKEPFAHKAERLLLEHSVRPLAAFRTIAASCFRQFRLNEDILLGRRNPEALHQARVASRRLRSAFSLFKDILPGDVPARLQDELRWIAGVLGHARNVDVLLAKAKDADLRWKLKAVRKSTYDDAVDALESSRARAVMLDFNEWLYCSDFDKIADQAKAETAAEFAGKALERMRRKLKKHGQALADVDDEHRHQVRKDAKKLRYAAEFFASLFDDKRGARRYRKFTAAMEEMQDHLGELNDLVTGPDVLKQHGLSGHPAENTVLSHADKADLIAKAQDSIDEVLDTKRFWR